MDFKRLSLCILILSAPLLHAWESVEVGADQHPPEASPAWYRCRLQVPDRLVVPEANNPRDLWRSSTMLVVAGLPSRFEVLLNAEPIIASDGVPAGRSVRFKIPKGIFRPDEFNTLVIRIEDGGLTEQPMLIDYFNELTLGPAWEVTDTEPVPGDLRAVAEAPATAVYTAADFRPSSTPLDSPAVPVHGMRVPPAEALALLETDADLVVEELLHEPQVAQPTHLSFDARGRMWVSQYRQYPFPEGLKMVSRDQYYRSKYDRLPPAPPDHDRGADIISVHEDTDGDGFFDKHTNALTGLNMANAAVRGWGGLWVMHTPYLLFYPDADGDDRPDRAPEIRLAGFGLEDTHSVANGLVWGPDGWLYGGQGSTTTSRITRPDIDPEDTVGIYNEGCLVWRYHPRSREFEVFADGGGNIFGLSFDAEGRLFSGHNGGDTRGWHHIQEGQFLKQGKDPGKFGPPPNPYAFGELPMMRSTNPVPRFSHMAAVAGGTAMPGRLRGQLLGVDPLHHYLVASERRPHGSTFETTDTGFPLRSEDVTFRPVFLANAPDGSMVVADFREEFIAHGQNYQGQIDPESGRIYRLRGKSIPLESDTNLEAKSDAELVQILDHPNLWHRQTAARLLGQRADPAVVPALVAALENPATHPALDALWALHQMGRLDVALATAALGHPAPAVRAWAIRLVGDSRELPPAFLSDLTALARTEPSPEVRCQILSTACRLAAEDALALLGALPLGAEDTDDPFIPMMVWFLIESHCAESRDLVLGFFEQDELWRRPVVEHHVISRLVRRFAEAGTRADLLTCAELFRLAPTPEARAELLAGFDRAFDGRIPPAFPDRLLAHLGQGSLSMRIRQQRPEALAHGIALLADATAPEADRLAAVRAFGTIAYQDARAPLLELATTPDQPLQRAALSSLQIYDAPSVGEKLAADYLHIPAPLRPLALNILASRPHWAIQLLESPAIPRGDIDPDLVARMRMHGSGRVDELLGAGFPAPESDDPAAEAEAIRAILAAKPGDPYRGEATYTNRCASCHTLFFRGGQVGPDLTRYQRDDLGTMLHSILDPNAEIREGYENYIATTDDGRVLSGFLAEEDANTIVLRGFDGSDTTLPRHSVTALTPAGRSLMPEGLLTGLDDQQLRDLFAYLKISQPISK
ncbi:HEAT repeat domain-containing protein [soil metagenome]